MRDKKKTYMTEYKALYYWQRCCTFYAWNHSL